MYSLQFETIVLVKEFGKPLNCPFDLLLDACTIYFNFDHFQAEGEEDEADDDELNSDEEDKENIESKAGGSSLPNKRKRDNDDDTNGDE
jgi:hypothetical protein